MNRSAQWFDRARRVLPGGVNSPVRAFKSVGGTPLVIVSANGCQLTDADGRTYLDYIGSWGPMIAGHAHPAVLARVEETLRRGTTFGLLCTLEIELAEAVIRRVPTLERIRFVNSGTEAVMSAIRLARAVTQRPKIIKFNGCYHGHADAMLVRAGSGVATLGLPDSPGVTPGSVQDTLTAAYNDLAAVEALFAAHGSQVAAVIVEPVAGNMGVVPPKPGFLAFLREITRRHGALLLLDEVMTGFRVAPGGAQELYGIQADLVTFGKVVGGGFPIGAYAGPAEFMDRVAPAGPVYQAGTFSGNPMAMAAGLATLNLLDDYAYARLDRLAARLQDGIQKAMAQVNVPAVVQRVGSMLTLFFTDRPVRSFTDAQTADHVRFAKFFHAMLHQGIHLPPSGYEAWFVSLAHDDEVVEQTLQAVRASLVLES